MLIEHLLENNGQSSDKGEVNRLKLMKSHRPERIANVIRAVISEAIAHKLNDPRIAPLSTVTRVEVSGDLEYAKVWISVLGEAKAQKRTMAGLASATGHVQSLVARKLPIRHCPRISFHLDESLRKGAETIRLIDQLMAQAEGDSLLSSEQNSCVESEERAFGDDA